jgi:hypothetical protein
MARVRMTRKVKAILLVLQCYILAMLALIVFKFIKGL